MSVRIMWTQDFLKIYLPPGKALIAKQLADKRIPGATNQRVAIGERGGFKKYG